MRLYEWTQMRTDAAPTMIGAFPDASPTVHVRRLVFGWSLWLSFRM
jgi:hypothetical protein